MPQRLTLLPANIWRIPFGLGRLSTGTRLFLLLLISLSPLALAAVLANQQLNLNSSLERSRLVQTALEDSAARLSDTLVGNNMLLAAAADRLGLGEDAMKICDRLKRQMALRKGPSAALIHGDFDNSAICVMGNVSPEMRRAIASKDGKPATILPYRKGLLIRTNGDVLFAKAVAFYSGEQLLEIADPADQLPLSKLEISQAETVLPLTDLGTKLERRLDTVLTAETGILGLQLSLKMARSRVSSPELLVQIIPFLMMIAASIIGWVVVNRMLMNPVLRLRQKMTHYQTGERIAQMPYEPYNASEIEELDHSFARLAAQVADDKAALDSSLATQISLTREVHHRVKNNLQIIASLINLHGRSATSDGERQAYAAIQKRVEALSVVQRNHHADSGGSFGINLHSLVGELVANNISTRFDGTALAHCRVDIDDLYVSQDVAMPIAFLLTEVFDLIVLTMPEAGIAVTAARDGGGNNAILSIQSPALGDNPAMDVLMANGIARILKGLSQQLRAPLEHDRDTGGMQIRITLFHCDNGGRPVAA